MAKKNKKKADPVEAVQPAGQKKPVTAALDPAWFDARGFDRLEKRIWLKQNSIVSSVI